MMKLSQLIDGLLFLEKHPCFDAEITGIAIHPKAVRPGYLFVAIVGTEIDGHTLVEEALKKGASALIVEKQIALPNKNIPLFLVQNSRDTLSDLAARWNQNPSQALPVIGVTGTNGKTTITHLLGHIFRAAGKNPGIIGTLGAQYNKRRVSHPHTTPEALMLHKLLRKMKAAKVNAVAMEISSHALDLHRVEDVCFDAAVFTNLTPEHLDYHHTMEEYYRTKARLFSEILPKGKGQRLAIINADDPYGARLIKALQSQPVWTYSTQDKGSTCDFQVRGAHFDLHGMKGVIVTPKETAPFTASLIGVFNLSNILAATAAGLSIGIPLTSIVKALQDFPGVPGRLEKIENNHGIHVFVDYAHTPDALKNVLTALRALNPKKIITVFGCGGNRDKIKRPLMGQEVARLSDLSIITSDNPRTEDPRQIIQEILAGIKTGGIVIPDRREAIELAIKKANPGDVVLIAGKGHETYQIIGTEKIHFDDREVAREALKKP